jgi:ABC-type bacteriocin/lantibiotic exporter with double-glycine peptidase domain
MLRCAKELGLKARAPTVNWKQLASAPVPVIASLRGGGFLLIIRVTDDKVVVLQPNLPRPGPMMRSEFETVWDGRLVVMTRRNDRLMLLVPPRHGKSELASRRFPAYYLGKYRTAVYKRFCG